MTAEVIAIRALEKIIRLDLAKTPEGRDDYFSGPGRFFRAWLIAYHALKLLRQHREGR